MRRKQGEGSPTSLQLWLWYLQHALLSCSAWGKNSRVTGRSWKPENLWKMASWLASPEAELRQRFLGKSFERVLQETKSERIGQGKQLSKELCGGETSCGLTLQWWHSGGLAAPRGALLEARFPSVSQSLAEGCWEMVAGGLNLTDRQHHWNPGQHFGEGDSWGVLHYLVKGHLSDYT